MVGRGGRDREKTLADPEEVGGGRKVNPLSPLMLEKMKEKTH